MGTKKGRKHFGKIIIEEVLKLKSEEKSNREISDHYGYGDPEIIRELLKRHNRKQRKIALGETPKKKGRPPKPIIRNKDDLIKQLKMENELLRSFLSETGRK